MSKTILNQEIAKEIAMMLWHRGAVGVDFQNPRKFKSGIISPIYCDNRKLYSDSDDADLIIDSFSEIAEQQPFFEMVFGVATGGIIPAAQLAYQGSLGCGYVRVAKKDHGTEKLVEGKFDAGTEILVIEDLITTGGSSLAAVKSLRDEGGVVETMLAIFTYGFAEAEKAFEEADVKLYTLTDCKTVFQVGLAQGYITDENYSELMVWYKDPWAWGK